MFEDNESFMTGASFMRGRVFSGVDFKEQHRYVRIDLPYRVPAKRVIYLREDEAPKSGHARIRLMTRIRDALVSTKGSGVQAVREALKAAGMDARVQRDEGTELWVRAVDPK